MKPKTILRSGFIVGAKFLFAVLPHRRACQIISAFTRYLPWEWGQPLIAHLSPLLNGFKLLPFEVRTKEDFEMSLDLADTSIQRYVYFLREWEPNEARIIKSTLKEGDTFLDVGANIGYFSLLAAQVIGSAGRVYAFEAQPTICSQFARNVKLNRLGNVRLSNVAVADKVADFVIEDVSALGNRGAAMLVPREASMPVIKVAGTTIDEFCRTEKINYVSLIKMDIEGSEMLALRGMRNLLSQRNAPDLVCEINEPLLRRMGSSGDEIRAYMRDMGYSMYKTNNGGREKVVENQPIVSTDSLGDNYFFSKSKMAI